MKVLVKNAHCTTLAIFALLCSGASAQLTKKSGLDGLKEVPLSGLSQANPGGIGQQALAIRSAEWKHAETANFIYHYFQSFVATPVSVEAEFYYRIISEDLGKESAQWERKCQVYIFERDADWAQFQVRTALDPMTGGVHARGELAIVRNPEYKFKGPVLGHEVAHLVIDRFYGSNVPLWLNEGYAEYAASRGYAAFHRARNYVAKPVSTPVLKENYIPLAQLTETLTYPKRPDQMRAFYDESHRLVRFLSAKDPKQFRAFLQLMATGSRTDSALLHAFPGRWTSLAALDQEFQPYAIGELPPEQ